VQQTLSEKLPRLLVLTSTFPRWKGDKEPRFVYDLCRRLSSSYQIHVVAPHAPGAAKLAKLDGITVYRFPYLPERWESLAYEGGILSKLKNNRLRTFQVPFFVFFQFLAVRKIMTRMNFAAIHAHWIVPQGFIAILAQVGRYKVPVLCTSHGGDLFGLKGLFWRFLRYWTLKRSAAITVVSNAMALELGPIAEKIPCWVIPMGTNLSNLFKPALGGCRQPAVLLFVGRLVEKKGVGYLIRAFGRVKQAIPNATLWIVGSGPYEDTLKELADTIAPVVSVRPDKCGVVNPGRIIQKGSIAFFGKTSHMDLPRFYRSAAVTVVPSVVAESGDQEGFGLVIVEALGCACAVVASDLPAIRDIITDGETGLLARPADPEDLAAKALRILTNPSLAADIARKGRTVVTQKYAWDKIALQYHMVLANIINTATNRALKREGN